ncbi:hypothetical protein DFH27DRAFT_27379 [Peziza echinospora]|nr:hypothetical protein DFH27DRAFT_27379 [Peziza echinospora]
MVAIIFHLVVPSSTGGWFRIGGWIGGERWLRWQGPSRYWPGEIEAWSMLWEKFRFGVHRCLCVGNRFVMNGVQMAIPLDFILDQFASIFIAMSTLSILNEARPGKSIGIVDVIRSQPITIRTCSYSVPH